MDMIPIWNSEPEEEAPSFASALIGELERQHSEEQIPLSRSEVVKNAVLEELEQNFLYKSEQGSAASVIAAALPVTWWVKQTEKEVYEIIRLLYAMVEERAANKKKKEAREAARLAALEAKKNAIVHAVPSSSPRRFFGAAARRPAAAPAPREREATAVPVIALSVPVAPPVQAVLDRCAAYMANPETRPAAPLPIAPLKDDRYLSARTKADYKRGAAQVRRVLEEQGRKTGWDMCAYLVEVALSSSVSTYKRQRAMLLRLVEGRDSTAHIAAMVRALPPYAEMCELLGRQPSRRSTPVTEARRAAQNEKTFTRLLSHLSPEHRDAILALRFAGARSCEAESMRLERVADGVRVTISSAKTGARKRIAPAARSWVVPAGTPEATILSGVLDRRGERPAPYSADSLRAAWRRVRLREGLNADPHWDLHSLRHQYAADEKKKTAAELRRQFGADWRRSAFGRNWRENPEYAETFYGELARRMGHTNKDMCKIYG